MIKFSISLLLMFFYILQNGKPTNCKQVNWNRSNEGAANSAEQQLLWLAMLCNVYFLLRLQDSETMLAVLSYGSIKTVKYAYFNPDLVTFVWENGFLTIAHSHQKIFLPFLQLVKNPSKWRCAYKHLQNFLSNLFGGFFLNFFNISTT